MEAASKTALSPDSMSSEATSAFKDISQDAFDSAKSLDTFHKLLTAVAWFFGTLRAHMNKQKYSSMSIDVNCNGKRQGKKSTCSFGYLGCCSSIETFATQDVCEKLVCLGKACAGLEAWPAPEAGVENEVSTAMDAFGEIVPCLKPAALFFVSGRCFSTTP